METTPGSNKVVSIDRWSLTQVVSGQASLYEEILSIFTIGWAIQVHVDHSLLTILTGCNELLLPVGTVVVRFSCIDLALSDCS